tara:strand:- start:586 stop:846 length:261 start_codon:yes stop_codon:yes gene_type:complete
MAITIITNTYHHITGEFHSSDVAGTFENHDDAKKFLKEEILWGGEFKQIAPRGWEQRGNDGKLFQHVSINDARKKSLDINGNWETA